MKLKLLTDLRYHSLSFPCYSTANVTLPHTLYKYIIPTHYYSLICIRVDAILIYTSIWLMQRMENATDVKPFRVFFLFLRCVIFYVCL